MNRPPTIKARAQRRKAGLTLIEVMLALTILGMGVAGLVMAAGRCIAVARKARILETARQLMGQVELEEPLILKEEVEEGTESGTFQDAPDGYRWTRDVRILGEEEDGLFEVKTRVYWTDRGKEDFEEVVTYLFSPELIKRGTTGD